MFTNVGGGYISCTEEAKCAHHVAQWGMPAFLFLAAGASWALLLVQHHAPNHLNLPLAATQ